VAKGGEQPQEDKHPQLPHHAQPEEQSPLQPAPVRDPSAERRPVRRDSSPEGRPARSAPRKNHTAFAFRNLPRSQHFPSIAIGATVAAAPAATGADAPVATAGRAGACGHAPTLPAAVQGSAPDASGAAASGAERSQAPRAPRGVGANASAGEGNAAAALAPLLQRFGTGAEAWQALQAPRGSGGRAAEAPLPTPAEVAAAANAVLARASGAQPPWWVEAPSLVETVSYEKVAAELLFAWPGQALAATDGAPPSAPKGVVPAASAGATTTASGDSAHPASFTAPTAAGRAASGHGGSGLAAAVAAATVRQPNAAPPVAIKRCVALSQSEIASLVLNVPVGGCRMHSRSGPGCRPVDVRFCRGAWKLLERSGPCPDYALWDYDAALVRHLGPESRLPGLGVEGSAASTAVDHDAGHLASVVMHRVFHWTCRRWADVVQHAQCLPFASAQTRFFSLGGWQGSREPKRARGPAIIEHESKAHRTIQRKDYRAKQRTWHRVEGIVAERPTRCVGRELWGHHH
jgi:hypothetical protein